MNKLQSEKPKISAYRRQLLVCTGPRCTQHGESQALFDSLEAKLKAVGLDEGEQRIKHSSTHCFAVCKLGPILCVQPDGVWYYNVSEENLDRIIEEHLLNGEPVEDLIFHLGPGCIENFCGLATAKKPWN